MYVGNVGDGSGLHQMLYEVVNYAIAEGAAGYCDRVEIHLNANGSVLVRDFGRGIPTHSWHGASIPEIIMTQLHAAGKFEHDAVDVPELQGVGVAVVNALSERLDLRIWRGGREHHGHFVRGHLEAPLTAQPDSQGRCGTEFMFVPDSEIFHDSRFEFGRIAEYLRQLAHLGLGVAVSLTDHRPTEPRSAAFPV